MDTPKTYELAELGSIIEAAKTVAQNYYRLTGKPLGITGEIAEYEAARLLGLRLAPVRQTGYDAVREDGASTVKYQIKSRCLQRQSKSGRMGSIRLDHEWDAVLLVLLDEDYEPIEIYEAQRHDIKEALSVPGSKARNERGALSVSKFKSIGRKVWSSE